MRFSGAPPFSVSGRASPPVNGPVTATLVVDNEVSEDGTTYNIMGRIPGRSSDYQIIVGGHYDVHFTGFQDDNCAVGLVLAMAKAMIDSGYQPENDIVFCLHGAEEWGSSYTQYDWTVGAWEMINHVHPEWVGKTLAFLNFELPAYEFSTYTSTYSAPEMYAMLDYFANEYPYSPDPEGCFPDGVLTDGYQTYTYSDDFSYYAAGVPSTVNGFLLQNDDYAAAREEGDTAALETLWAQGRALTAKNLAAFQFAQKNLLGLMYERPIVPHEAPQENIQLCQSIIACLETGDVATAVDEYAWTVNNVLEWYAMYFSPEVIAIQDDMLWGADNQDNLYWGTDIGFTKADVDAATRSLFVRYEEDGGDFSQEIAVYQAAIQAQTQILADLGAKETQAMLDLSALLG